MPSRHVGLSQRLVQQPWARTGQFLVVCQAADRSGRSGEHLAGVGDDSRRERASREHERPDKRAGTCEGQDLCRPPRAPLLRRGLAFDHEAASHERVDDPGEGGLRRSQLFGQRRAREARGPAQRLEHFALARPKRLAPRGARAFPSVAHRYQCNELDRIQSISAGFATRKASYYH